MENYSTLAMGKFVSPDLAIGQRVLERLVVKFSEAGYTVTNYEKLKKLSGKDVLTSAELTPTDKTVLQQNSIKAVVYGTIDRYDCRTQEDWTWTGFEPEKTSFDLCSASLSIRVVDAVTGAVIWQTQEAQSEKAPSMARQMVKESHAKRKPSITARMVMEKVLTRIEDEIPKINK
jgi:hypothetical protein